jgi:hypothetical protein
MSCEEKFDIDIPNHVATKFVTVGDAIAFIRDAIAAGGLETEIQRSPFFA